MPVRATLAFWLGLLSAAVGFAQEPERPTELPPLLTPPPASELTPRPQPTPHRGRGPVGEYDHNHLYLPNDVPSSKPPETCRPLGWWWVNPSLELAWLPSQSTLGTVRLRVPDGSGGTVPGPVVPAAGGTADNFQGGFGLSVGRFIGDAHVHAVEGSFYTVGSDRTFDGFAPGMLVVFPQGSSRSTAQVFVFPPPMNGGVVGGFPVTVSTAFVGADVNYRRNVLCNPDARLDVLAGYRFAYLSEEVYLGDVPDPAHDNYKQNRALASNTFNGGQVGVAGEVRANKWYAGGAAKVAFGVVTGEVAATGYFVGAEGATTGGYRRLAALADSTQTRFAVLPTVNLTAGRQIREHARVFVGYTLQYLNRTARLGDVLDPNATGTPASDFWVQAMNLGLELRY